MASSEKKRLKEWQEFTKKADKIFENVEKDRARRFVGLPDRLLNVLFTVIASALVLFFTYFKVGFVDIVGLSESLFTGEGFSSSAGSWGIIAGVLGLSTGVSANRVKLPKFLKKLTVRPGLIASVAVLIALPDAVEAGTLTEINMILIAFGAMFYSCFASRSDMYNINLERNEKKIANRLENVKKLVMAQISGQGAESDTSSEFIKVAKQMSGNKSSARRMADAWIFAMALLITAAWAFLITIVDVKLVSSIAVILFVAVMEIIEAFQGPSTKDASVDQRISKDGVSNVFAQLQQLMSGAKA